MRLAYLTSFYPAPSQVFLQREVRGLRERGIDVLAVSVRRPVDVLSPADREEAATAAFLVPARADRLIGAFLRALRRPGALAATLRGALRDAPAGRRAMQLAYWGEAVLLWDLLRRHGISHVHVHFANNASDIALLAVRLGRATGEGPQSFSLHLHGPTDFFDVERNRLGLKGAEASGVICISDYARAQALSHLPPGSEAKVHVARYGGPPGVRARPPRDRSGPLRILNVGRLAPVKGHAMLLEALASLDVDARLDVVGAGPLEAELRARAGALGVAGRVTWHGALGHDAVEELYAQADLFCLPSFAEGLPVVLLEAMAHRLPIVATRITGVPEAITDGVEGLLVAPARPDELAAAIERVAADAGFARRLAEAGARRIATELSHEASIRQIEAALRAVVP